MRILVSGLCLVFWVQTQAHGLENIIIEKYYISDANDAAATGGRLPIGSVTYRIYADMLPVYRFQAAYGLPGHELRLATTTFFFNHEDRGATVANDIPDKYLYENTVMLDSWLSVGAASEGDFGILKTNDNGVATVENTSVPKVLQNADPAAGIPLTVRDGLIASSPQSAVTLFGLDSAIHVFRSQNAGTKGQLFTTTDGSWASFGGSIGPDTTNMVLIAQITTDGILTFELNIQIGTPGGKVENYVAKNPVGSEIQFDGLNYPVPATKDVSKNNTTPQAKKISK